MNNRQVAQAFADGATKGQGSNLFIDGDAIYSYGHHFAIARRRAGQKPLWNYNTYSVSTTRHQSYVRSAMQSKLGALDWNEHVVMVDNPEVGVTMVDAMYWVEQFNKALERVLRARTVSGIAARQRDKDQAMHQIQLISVELGISVSPNIDWSQRILGYRGDIKIGSRVKLITEDITISARPDFPIGSVGMVVDIEHQRDSLYVYMVKFDHNGQTRRYFAKSLEVETQEAGRYVDETAATNELLDTVRKSLEEYGQ